MISSLLCSHCKPEKTQEKKGKKEQNLYNFDITLGSKDKGRKKSFAILALFQVLQTQ